MARKTTKYAKPNEAARGVRRSPKRKLRHEELELKLSNGAPAFKDVIRRLSEKYGFFTSRPVTIGIRDYYYDTDAWWFHRAGAAFRVRRTGGKTWLTLKSLHPARNGVVRRVEMEEALPKNTVVNLSKKIPDGRIRDLLKECGAPLQLRPLFKLDSSRTFIHCRNQSGQHLVISLDRSKVMPTTVDQARAPVEFEEMEIEHLEGNPSKTRKLLKRISKKKSLSPSEGSKFERSLDALELSPARTHLHDGALTCFEDRLIDTAYKVLTFHFERLCGNEPGTRLGIDPEYLHDMRVASRRLRTALRTFQQALPTGVNGLFEADLRWLAATLAPVRDVDVYLENLSERESSLEPAELQVVQFYKEDLLTGRDASRKQMLEALNSERYTRFVERFQAFLKRGPAQKPSATLASLSSVRAACVIIQQALDHVERRGRKALKKTTPERLHSLRIAFKRLRYTCEWFGGHFDSRFSKFTKKVIKMQSLLGAHHDSVVAAQRLSDSAKAVQKEGKHPGLLLLALGKLIALECQRTGTIKRRFPKAWKAFSLGKNRTRCFKKPVKAAMKIAPKPVAG